MSKYNKGDKFILEVDYLVTGTDGDMYYKMNLDNIVLSAESLDKLQKCETELSWDEAYIKGLEDAWELADKINNMPMQEVINVYGFITDRCSVFEKITSQEALAKLKAYEKSKEIKVGDVVEGKDDDVRGVVVGIRETCCYILFRDGSAGKHEKDDFKKTGKHIDITSVLEQLRGD